MTNPARNYVARLFQVQYNLILLGGAALFSLASASPFPLIAALALEALWLGVGSRMASVRRWVDARDAFAVEVEKEAVVKSALDGLESEYASRVLALEHGLGELKSAEVGADNPDPAATQQNLGKIGAAFVKMCHTHQRLGGVVNTMPEAELGEEVQRLKQAFSAEKDLGLRLGIKQSIALAQRRVDQREKMVSTLRNLSVRLDSVERSVADLRGQARAVGLNAEVATEIEALATELGSDSLPPPESDDFGDFAPGSVAAAANSSL